MAERTWTDDDVRDLGERTRAAQGLPPTITDPTALARIAEITADHDDEAAAS